MISEKDTPNDIKHILLISNNRFISNPIRELLISNEYSVSFVEDREKALAAIDQRKPDLIISTLHSDFDGPEDIADLLGKDDGPIDIPLLIVSPSNINVNYFIKGLQRGMNYHITLPCEGRYLLSRIEDIITNHRKDAVYNEKVGFEIIFNGDRNRLELGDRQFMNFLLSSFENAVHHSKLLVERFGDSDLLFDRELPERARMSTARADEVDRLTDEVIGAIENQEFFPYYQPIISMKSGRIVGFEALCRWNHPERGIISPDEFIPFMEETGLIIPVGFQIIDKASRQLKIWQDMFPSDPPLTVSINLSTVQFIHPELAERIERVVKDNGVDTRTIRFEITESALMNDMQSANLMLLKLKAMNFQLCMDDFGTGYSSLSYLRHFPVDILKIDQSFVRWMGVDDESDEIVRIIVYLAHRMKMMVVAEGVEKDEHLKMVRELNCEYGQGFLFSEPLDVSSIEELLHRGPQWL
jgi:EAL domain-containing protein (putative c-di-GMP-specific phosphodiesterase class I)/DNA-binding response OmpR family regulator